MPQPRFQHTRRWLKSGGVGQFGGGEDAIWNWFERSELSDGQRLIVGRDGRKLI